MTFNYSNGLIYKIVCNNPEITDCYVGSTTNFKQRKTEHKSDCNNEKRKNYNYRIYQTIRANGGWQNWSMLEVEKYSCNDKRELHSRERYWLEQLKANLNCRIPTRTEIEYRKNNKHILKEYFKDYYQENKDKIKEQQSQLIECQCGSVSRKSDIAKHKKSKKHQFYEKINEFIYS
jgi:hypothetical protein